MIRFFRRRRGDETEAEPAEAAQARRVEPELPAPELEPEDQPEPAMTVEEAAQASGAAEPAATAGPKLSFDEARWAIRILCGREPLSEFELDVCRSQPSLDALRHALTNSWEFHEFFDATLTQKPVWAAPLFLLRPPQDPALPWRFAPPDLETPSSQLCTASQFRDDAFAEITRAMGFAPARKRWLWEQAWIVSVVATEGLVAPDRRGFGFFNRRDRLASLFASRGVEVTATAQPTEFAGRLSALVSQLHYPELIAAEDYERLVTVRHMEWQQMPEEYTAGYDFCWSVNAPGKVGSIAAAMDFFEASLRVLKPGGIAAHVMQFNLTSDRLTWESPEWGVVLRRSDIEALAARLAKQGHTLLPLNTHPGFEELDEQVVTRPDAPPGIRQRHGVYVLTSFGLAIRKGAPTEQPPAPAATEI